MEEYPEHALSWFAVGCYYMATRQFDQARHYFGKATALDKNSAAAWVGFGHAFAAQVRLVETSGRGGDCLGLFLPSDHTYKVARQQAADSLATLHAYHARPSSHTRH